MKTKEQLEEQKRRTLQALEDLKREHEGKPKPPKNPPKKRTGKKKRKDDSETSHSYDDCD